MSRFDFILKYIVGKSIGQADSLKRRADWAERVERGNIIDLVEEFGKEIREEKCR